MMIQNGYQNKINFIDIHKTHTEDCIVCDSIAQGIKDNKLGGRGFEVFYGECHLKLEGVAQEVFEKLKAAALENNTNYEVSLYWLNEKQCLAIQNAFFSRFDIIIGTLKKETSVCNNINSNIWANSNFTFKFLIEWPSDLCDSVFSQEPEPLLAQEFIPLPKPDYKEKLTKQWELAIKGEGCDVKIITYEGALQAHSFVLITSEYFKTILNPSFKEGKSKEITLLANEKIVKALLEYIYMDEINFIDFSKQEFLDLFELSVYCQEPKLSDTCLYHLNKGIIIEEKKAWLSDIKHCVHDKMIALMLYWVDEDTVLLGLLKKEIFGCEPEFFNKLEKFALEHNLAHVQEMLANYKSFATNLG